MGAGNSGPDLLEALVANSGPGGPECEAKSVETCRCGSPSDWKPIMMPNSISPTAARQALEQGIRVQDPLGKELPLDGKILRHWEKAGKSQKDISKRGSPPYL